MFIDPKKRILRDIKADQFSEKDFESINKFVGTKGKILTRSSIEEESDLTTPAETSNPNEKLKRDVAYLIRNLRQKKRLCNDIDGKRTDESPEDEYEEDMST